MNWAGLERTRVCALRWRVWCHGQGPGTLPASGFAKSKGIRTVPQFKTMAAGAAAVVVGPFVPPAFAHHVMGGELPSTAWQGVLSGLGHPIIGIDHCAFVIGVGLISHLAGRLLLLPLLFVVGTALGCLLQVQGYGLPFAELSIALTIAVAAVVVGM